MASQKIAYAVAQLFSDKLVQAGGPAAPAAAFVLQACTSEEFATVVNQIA